MGDMGGEWTSKARDEKARLMSWWNMVELMVENLTNASSSGVSAQIPGEHLDSKNKAGGRLSHLALKKGFGLENGFGPVKT